MKRLTMAVGLVLAGLIAEAAGQKGDVVVMTQNQYLGADLAPIITAPDASSFNESVIAALQSIAANSLPERVEAMAASIANRQPHLVGLQEVFDIGCIEIAAGACSLFGPAFNDHLALTMGALAAQGADYEVAAVVENFVVPFPGFPLPGLPLFLDLDAIPDAFITVRDRDVILARFGVATVPVPFICARPSGDGCSFDAAAGAMTLLGPVEIPRGFVGVDAVVAGDVYRFVNTHLELQFPAPDPLAPGIQAAQATQLIATLSAQPPAPGGRILVVGDINSSPDHLLFPDPVLGPFHPPYRQLTNGTDLFGAPISVPYGDVWDLRPGNPSGFTCCELADLSNRPSEGDERIDVIFASPPPARVKANVLDEDFRKARGVGGWASDHFGVLAELSY